MNTRRAGLTIGACLAIACTSLQAQESDADFARIVTLTGQSSGINYQIASSQAYFSAHSQCLSNQGSQIGFVSYWTISQPPPGKPGQWLVRATIQCQLP
jgi:hypothetical protein